MNSRGRSALGALALATTAMLSVGCGQMTIRTWVTIIEQESGGFVEVKIGNGIPLSYDMLRLQGGFLTEVTLDTAELPGPMHGTLALRDVRIAGEVAGFVGKLCTWNDPEGSSGGTLTVDLFGGTTETEVFLDAKASTTITDNLNLPPVDFEENIEMDLGGGLGVDQFLAAFNAGTPAGLFATESTISSTIVAGAITNVFEMNAVVTNGAEPPSFDPDLLAYCQDHFDSQGYGDALFYSVNPKAGYLRRNLNDVPKDPLVISLAEIGASAGDTLHLEPVGTWHWGFALKDGAERQLGAVFSSSDEILDVTVLDRIPGAIDVAPGVNTWPSIFCLFGECTDLGGDDIPEDFLVNPSRDIVVPAGAEYLVVAVIDNLRAWGDNTGMGFGVKVAVNP